jgi:hypothetical protein
VPASQDTYRIRVFIPDIPVKHVIIPASNDRPADMVWVLDEELIDKEATRRTTAYCRKMNRLMTITAREFDVDRGLDLTFKCMPRETSAP